MQDWTNQNNIGNWFVENPGSPETNGFLQGNDKNSQGEAATLGIIVLVFREYQSAPAPFFLKVTKPGRELVIVAYILMANSVFTEKFTENDPFSFKF